MLVNLGEFCRLAKIQPILVDLGASGETLHHWQPIAGCAVVVGFDPDSREMFVDTGGFSRRHVVPKAVTADGAQNVKFFLTRSPFCSSVLEPDRKALGFYLMSDLFDIVSTVEVPACSLMDALTSLEIDRIDWFKADTQGTDLRIFQSLSEEMRRAVMAVDVEPGLVNFYRNEDLFAETHAQMLDAGFWISRLQVKGSVRMSSDSLSDLDPDLASETAVQSAFGIRESPAWCEARYLRTLDSLEEADRRSWILSWVFAMLDGQPGHAMDVARAFGRRFDDRELCSRMHVAAEDAIRRNLRGSPLRRAWARFVPEFIRRRVWGVRHWLSPNR